MSTRKFKLVLINKEEDGEGQYESRVLYPTVIRYFNVLFDYLIAIDSCWL